MRLKRWQAGLFALSILWALFGTGIAIAVLPEDTNIVRATIKNLDETQTYLSGKILDRKYDAALQKRLITGVGENEMLSVIILLDQQNPQREIARSAIQRIGGDVLYEYHLFQGMLSVIPANSLSSLAGSSAIVRICDDYVLTLPRESAPIPALVDTSNWWRGAIGASSVSETGTGVKIAILDTGLGYLNSAGSISYHEDFPLNRIAAARNFASEDGVVNPSYTFDWFGHGTHVAGIALGSGAASSGKYGGIAPGASLLVGRVLNSSGGGEFSTILMGLEWAVDQGADIVSMSLGGGGPDVFTPDGLAIQNATQQNVMVVASAGNSGPDYFSGGTPGSLLYTLSAGASDRNNKIADFSSVGPSLAMQTFPSIAAPGVDIIAPLASNSYIQLEEAYRGNVITGSSGSDYVPLSGTSMSSPMVAGAAALLLQAYPQTNATTLRIALMQSATNLGYPVVRQGSGLVNVLGAKTYLAALNPINNATQVFPEQVPFEPYDLLKFPGDAQTMNLTVISGIARNISVQLPLLEGITLTTSQPVLNFTNAGVLLWNLTVQVDLNASLGVKDGIINFTDGKTGEILDDVTINLTITLPKRRVYFDSFHGLNDIFNAVDDGTSQFELYNFAKAFTAKNYSVDLKMEYWTPAYDPEADGRLLTIDLLQNYDAVVLQTPSLPYTPTEVQALVEFHNQNGSILIIGDRYQSLTVDSVNNLLTLLGTGISFLPANFESIQFYGLYDLAFASQINISSNPDPMLTGVSSLLFEGGAVMQTTGAGMAVLDATSTGDTIIAKSTGTGIKGNVAVLSGPSFLKNIYMTDLDFGGNHTQFASKLIDYILPKQEFNIARKVTPERSSQGIIKTYLYVTNGSTGTPITGLLGGSDINLTSSNPAISGAVNSLTITEHADGIYVNDSYTLSLADPFPYLLNASVRVLSATLNSTAAAVRTDPTIPVITGISQMSDTIYRVGPSADTEQTLAVQTSSSLDSIFVYGGSTPLSDFSLFNTRNQFSFDIKMSGSAGSYHVSFNAISQTSGLYVYFFEGELSGYTNVISNRSAFEVLNLPPIIDEANSYFDSNLFNAMKTTQGYFPQQVTQGETHSFSVVASDAEDPSSSIQGVVVFVPAGTLNNTITFLLGDGEFPFVDLTWSSSGVLTGSITIPLTITYPKGDGTFIEESTASSGSYLSVFEVAVIDTDGGFTDYIVILQVAPVFDWLTTILVIAAIVAGIGIFAYIMRRRRASPTAQLARYKSPYEGNREAPPVEGYGYAPMEKNAPKSTPPTQLRKFCPNCGQSIPLEAVKCPHCGVKVPPMPPS